MMEVGKVYKKKQNGEVEYKCIAKNPDGSAVCSWQSLYCPNNDGQRPYYASVFSELEQIHKFKEYKKPVVHRTDVLWYVPTDDNKLAVNREFHQFHPTGEKNPQYPGWRCAKIQTIEFTEKE